MCDFSAVYALFQTIAHFINKQKRKTITKNNLLKIREFVNNRFVIESEKVTQLESEFSISISLENIHFKLTYAGVCETN